jgi:alkylhydroperoxidase family enzyme
MFVGQEIKMPNVTVPPAYQSDPLGYVLSHHAPAIGPAAGQFVRAVYQSLRLSLRIAEAARFRTAQINGCLVCQGMRAGDHLDAYLASVGGDPTQSVVARGGAKPDEAFYASVADWRTSPLFDPRERLAIEYAERLAHTPQDVAYDEAFWAGMHGAFSDAEITDLTLAIGCWMAMGRFTHALGLDTVCMTDMIGHAA